MSRIAQLALAAAAIAACSCLLAAACHLLLYREQNSGPGIYQRFHATIVDRFSYQVRHVFSQRIRAER